MSQMILNIPVAHFVIASLVIGLFLGCIIGWKAAKWFLSKILDDDMANGNLFVYKNGKWHPENPRTADRRTS